MPIFEYKCEGCGLSFEELKTIKEDSQSIPCRKCGAKSNKKMSSFAHSVPGGTTNETVDMHIGREADKKWQSYHDKQSKRHEGHSLQTFDLPKAPDNKYMPIMGLGTTQEKKDRNEFVGALQEHRKQRVEKGVPQFSEGTAV